MTNRVAVIVDGVVEHLYIDDREATPEELAAYQAGQDGDPEEPPA